MENQNKVTWTYKMWKSSPLVRDDIESFKSAWEKTGYRLLEEIQPVDIGGNQIQGSLVFESTAQR
jgi:hypothetical protein